MRKLKAGALALGMASALGLLTSPAMAEQPDYENGYADDRAEIEDLMARYLFAIDFHDWDAYVETFAPDGTIEFASGSFTGREVIREAVTAFSKRIGETYAVEDGSPAKLRHVILQSTVRVEGDRAWATSLCRSACSPPPIPMRREAGSNRFIPLPMPVWKA